MPKLSVKKGTTSKLVTIFVQDSTVTTGLGRTGLTSSTASAAFYLEGVASSSAVAMASMVLGTWVSGGFVEIDSTSMAGFYQFGVPNAALTGASSVAFLIRGSASVAPVPLEIQLHDLEPFGASMLSASAFGASAIDSVAFGLSAGSQVWNTGVRGITAIAASVITASVFAASAIDEVAFKLSAASSVWNAAVRTITGLGASVINASAFAASAIDKQAIGLGGASQIWNAAVRTISGTDASALGASAFTASAFYSGVFSTAGENALADAMLKRDMALVSGAASRSGLQALRFLRNRWSISGTTLTVYQEDDAATAWTAALTGDGAASPVTSLDPP